MKLFKNVDIVDLNSIVENGILPLNRLENSNWNSDNRVDNSDDVVYLFGNPKKTNSFTNYGLALIEVEVDEFEENEMVENDVNSNLYTEYITSEVPPLRIKKIYIPLVLKNRITDLSDDVLKLVKWVETSGYRYVLCDGGWYEKENAPKEIVKTYLGECESLNSNEFDYMDYIEKDTKVVKRLCELNYKF